MLLVIVIITATLLRFWDFTSIPFMHDEFSAIFRAQFGTFKELILKGIIPDAHPPGVQTFIFLIIKLFGVSEPVLKFPFLLTGVGSVILVYLVAEKWFGKITALMSASLIAVLQYNIFYSQLIRPYEPGLFFSLATVYFWTKIVFDDKIKTSDWIWFILFYTLNGYIHAFTIFFDLLVYLTGLLFINKKRVKKYIFSGLTAFMLMLPSLIIFIIQFKRGDIGGWLGKPEKDFIIEYFKYIFHFSGFFFSVVLFITLYFSFKYKNDKKVSKFRIIGISWFLITFLVAYFYSVFRFPVIQNSTLYFVFPFLVMVFFSFIGNMPLKMTLLSLSLILFTGISTLILDREHYRLMYHQGLNEIPKQVIEDIKKYNNPAVVLQAPQTRMFDYYFKKYGNTPAYFKLEKNDEIKNVLNYVTENKRDFLIVGIADYAPFTFLETVKSKYGYVAERITSQNMEYWVLSKKYFKGFKKTAEFSKTLKEIPGFEINRNEKYKGSITIYPDSTKFDYYDVLNAKLTVNKTSQHCPDAILVTDWNKKDNKRYYWSGKYFCNFYTENDSVYYVTFSSRIMNFKNIPGNSRIKFYVWKRDSSVININSLKVYTTRMDPVEIGLYKKIH